MSWVLLLFLNGQPTVIQEYSNNSDCMIELRKRSKNYKINHANEYYRCEYKLRFE